MSKSAQRKVQSPHTRKEVPTLGILCSQNPGGEDKSRGPPVQMFLSETEEALKPAPPAVTVDMSNPNCPHGSGVQLKGGCHC